MFLGEILRNVFVNMCFLLLGKYEEIALLMRCTIYLAMQFLVHRDDFELCS